MNLTLKVKDLELEFKDKKIYVDVYIDEKRQGTKSSNSWYYKYKGRWITYYERKKRNWPALTLNQTFRVIYSGPALKELISKRNPFLDMIPKNSIWSKTYALITGED